MIYFDTSYVIKCYLNEAGSAEVRRLAESANGIGCCQHGRLERETEYGFMGCRSLRRVGAGCAY